MEKVQEELEAFGCTEKALDNIFFQEQFRSNTDYSSYLIYEKSDEYVYSVGKFCNNFKEFIRIIDDNCLKLFLQNYSEFYKKIYRMCIIYYKWAYVDENKEYIHYKYTSEQVEYVINYLSNK